MPNPEPNTFAAMYASRKLPKCSSCHIEYDMQLHRGPIITNYFFWLPINKFACNRCMVCRYSLDFSKVMLKLRMIGMLSWLFKFSDYVNNSSRLLMRRLFRSVKKSVRFIFRSFKRGVSVLAEFFSLSFFTKGRHRNSTLKRRGYPPVTFFGRVFKRFSYFNRVFAVITVFSPFW
jgi:hypothetical protein